jgi:hypothetical protein
MDQERWRKVQGLLHAALGLEAEARHEFLSVACGGDIDLQLQVELLLAKEEEAGCFLETPAARYPTVTPTITVPLLGRQFGPYRIVCPLGSGGMGVRRVTNYTTNAVPSYVFNLGFRHVKVA